MAAVACVEVAQFLQHQPKAARKLKCGRIQKQLGAGMALCSCRGAVCVSKLADKLAQCEFPSWPKNLLRMSDISRCDARVGSLAPCENYSYDDGDHACRIALAAVCVSDHSRCGAARLYVADKPSAGTVRVGSLSLRRAWRVLCEDGSCRIALAAARVSDRSRCGVRVGSLALWRGAKFLRSRQALCEDGACALPHSTCQHSLAAQRISTQLCFTEHLNTALLHSTSQHSLCTVHLNIALLYAASQHSLASQRDST